MTRKCKNKYKMIYNSQQGVCIFAFNKQITGNRDFRKLTRRFEYKYLKIHFSQQQEIKYQKDNVSL